MRPSPQFHRRAGLTVAELLVSVSLIAILLAVLLPSLGMLRGRSEAVQCLANLRALGQAGLAQVQERGGLLPDMGVYAGHRLSERDYSLYPYLGYPMPGPTDGPPSAFTCPTAWRAHPTDTPAHRTFAVNRYATSSRINQPDDFEKIRAGVPMRFQNVTDLSKMAFFIEGMHRGGTRAATYYVDQNYSRMHPDRTPYLHSDHIHVVFLDGHVEAIHREYALEHLTERSSTTHPFWGSSR